MNKKKEERTVACVNACAGADSPQPGELARLRAGRVLCKACGGKDTAAIENARCYNCRNAPEWELENVRDRLSAAERQRDGALLVLRACELVTDNCPLSGDGDPCLRGHEYVWSLDAIAAHERLKKEGLL